MAEINILSRLTRDISEGIIVLNLRGQIVFVNRCIEQLLATDRIRPGVNYASFMMADADPRNDAFHQFLIDAVYDKSRVHSGDLVYHLPNGVRKVFHVTSSFLFSEDGKTSEGVIIQVLDTTEVATLREKVNDSAKVFVALLSGVCVWVIIYAVWDLLGQPIPSTVLTKMVELFGIGLFLYLLKRTSITISDMGLGTENVRPALVTDGIMTAVCLAVLVTIKIVLRKTGVMDAQAPFLLLKEFDWACWIYPVTVVLQEFLTRGVIQESIRRIIPGKNSMAISIITSSLFFAALHIHKGIVFMVGAFLLLSIFGVIYKKQKTIWGLCIPHLLLGWSLTLLFGI